MILWVYIWQAVASEFIRTTNAPETNAEQFVPDDSALSCRNVFIGIWSLRMGENVPESEHCNSYQ